jgi:DNA polymerase I-like protein with 3'-5' exonuclease and polymerase domains
LVTYDAGVVPCHLIQDAAELDRLAAALATAERVVIDTETPVDGPRAGHLRVLSIAVRGALDETASDSVGAEFPVEPHADRLGREQVFVVDARDVDPVLLAPVLAGVTADAWNADFDARVLDAAVWKSADTTDGITWWDAQLADALLYQGRSGFNWYHGLAWATRHYLGVDLEGKGTVQLSYRPEADLTDAQVSYAAADAVYTMWVGDRLRHELATAELEEVCEIEQAARPFLDQMQRSGLPFDWPGWRAELDRIDQRRRQVLTDLAMMTGGGQGSLFEPTVEPNWNPASDQQVRSALNQWAGTEVERWTQATLGRARHLTNFDSVTAAVLKEIGGPLSTSLLEFRNLTKILSTYGESIHEHLHDDGRIRPQYLQVVGTNTGRLASRNPNAQNLTPKMKPFIRPSDPDRVFVHADLSQAELRFLAQVADDQALRAAFARGVDVHVSTAATMFGFDPDELRACDPDRYKHLRQIAKALNFGIAYGSGAASLARSLTAEGTPTTRDEADALLEQYRRTYPGTAAWAQQRIAEIDDIARTVSAIDWPQSLRLARGFPTVSQLRRDLRADQGYWPDAEEIADLHPDRLTVERPTLVNEIDWLLGYSAPVALNGDGLPFSFASRTLAGRRQQFNLHLDRLFLATVVDAVTAPGGEMERVRRDFERDHGVQLEPIGSDDESSTRVARQFDDRSLRRLYVESLVESVGWPRTQQFLSRAAKQRVSAMVNAWRNAPIQGGVADIMLVAYADLHRRLGRFQDAVPVQTVHDSITVECAVDDAPALMGELAAALEAASRRFCPDVVPKADVDIRRSLSDADRIS